MEEQPVEPGALAVGVRFRPTGRIYDFDPGPLLLARDDRVLVETERGPALGTVVVPARVRPAARALQRVIKKADSRDLAREDQNLQRERQHYRAALELVRGRSLAAKLVKAESARDETKVTGGMGPCGRELCCSSWLQEFQPVSVRMAKEQGLSLNPSKLAGMCGRLKCCLRYEYQTYVELKRGLPAIGAQVASVKGDGTIVRQNVLKQTVVVRRAEDALEVEATLDDLVAPRAAE